MISNYFLGNFCYQNYCMERAYFLLLIIPLFFVLLFILRKDFVKFRSKEERKRFHDKNKWFRLYMLVTRTLILLFLLAALALPFTTEEVMTHGDPVIKVLVDSTESMDLFDSGLLDSVKEMFKGKFQVEISQISSGERSELGEGILKKIQGNDNLLLITDGNNNFGKSLLDVGLYARISDTRLFGLEMQPVVNDAYVEILGPSETIEGTPNRFKINVNYVGAQPSFTLQIYVDDKLEFSGMNIFEKDMLKTFGEGYHKITVKIINKDYFNQNNVFYKTVKAVPKPKILFLNDGFSPMEEGLDFIYDIKSMSSLPADISDYSAIVINDMPYSSLSSRIEDLTGFLLDGGGIVFIGGRHSFDKGEYKGTLLESMLPVTIGTGKVISPLKHNIVIVLDVSESFSDFSYKKGGQNTALDLGKGMAIKMIEGFRDDINIGLVAFASLGQIVSEPVGLKDNRMELEEMVKRLGKGEGTLIDQGLFMAEVALEKVMGTKNVILISDGKMGYIKEPHMPIRVAERMAGKGIKIFTVGLPSELYDIDINRHLMRKIAAIGNGNYFEPDETQYLNVFFGKPEEKEKIFSGSSNLAIIDKDHFITSNLELNARLTGINFVVPKLGARSLIFTGDGNPILNGWNFGLGRVITLATDDGSEWAGALLKKDNSMLITKVINYAVGNPERDKELYIDAQDGFLGEGNEIRVKSERYPVSKELIFTKEGENIYKAEFNAEKEGFYQFFDSALAVNPPREYYGLGQNLDLTEMVEISGGKMLKLDDKDMIVELQSLSERIETTRKDIKLYFLGAALIIFIIEIVIRKIYEHKKYQV